MQGEPHDRQALVVRRRRGQTLEGITEHFEPGEVIFQEGGHGDWLYIVVDGQVEVLKRIPGQGDATRPALQATIARGMSFLVTSKSDDVLDKSATILLDELARWNAALTVLRTSV